MSISIHWKTGTAVDLFVSLHVLHHPAQFGLRPGWAAGVRSRLPAAQREFLENAQQFMPVPLTWLHSLPPETLQDAGKALDALAALSPAERLPRLMFSADTDAETRELFARITAGGAWTPADVDAARAAYARRGISVRPAVLTAVCAAWSRAESFGDQYLAALREYVQVFFAEEEARIRPALTAAAQSAQELAGSLPLESLLERLSNGVTFAIPPSIRHITLAPSYWSSPLVFLARVETDALLVLFGGRPESDSLVPGEQVPAALLEALKGLADPTRLRILRYLGEEPSTPAGLARRLRLRPPTVIHHLNALRLAGLVQIGLSEQGEKHYTLRAEALESILQSVRAYLTPTGD